MALTLGIILLVTLVGGSLVSAAPGYGAQHGYVDLTVTDSADGTGFTGPYLVRNETELWGTAVTYEWRSRSRTCTEVNKQGNETDWTDWTEWSWTGNTNAPNTPGSPLYPSPAAAGTIQTGSGLGAVQTSYQWQPRSSGEPVLITRDIQTYNWTLYINAWGAMESWMANAKTFPLPGGKFSFSISSLDRVTAASWSVTKNEEPFAGGDLLGNLALQGPDNYPFPPAHEGLGPTHGAGNLMNDILQLDSTTKNDYSGGNRVVIVTPPSFTLDTDTVIPEGENTGTDTYVVTVKMTIKDGETGTSVTSVAYATITVTTTP